MFYWIPGGGCISRNDSSGLLELQLLKVSRIDSKHCCDLSKVLRYLLLV
jgi:hypothetical protein